MMLVGPSLTGLLQRPPLVQPLPLQGFAGDVTGGAGGTVYQVTNTNDSGAGSLRQAIADANADAGPAIVDIQVGGFIDTDSELDVTGHDITITGENAPGMVIIRGNQEDRWDGALIRFLGATNILLEHLRLHRGLCVFGGVNGKNFSMGDNEDGIAFRFCSLAWADDGQASVRSQNVTLQYCLLYESHYLGHDDEATGEIGGHSMGITTTTGGAIRLTIDKCIFAHINGRVPWRCLRSEMETINTIIYNWRKTPEDFRGGFIDDGVVSNVEQSLFISGPDEAHGNDPYQVENSGAEHHFAEGNRWITKDLIETVDQSEIAGGATIAGARKTFTTPPAVEVTRLDEADVWAHLKPLVGATKPARSATDARVLSHIENAVNKVSLDGAIIDNPADEDNNQNPDASVTAYATWAEAL